MKADQVIAAFSGFMNGDTDHAISVMHQIVASEQKSGRVAIASRIRRLLNGRMKMVQLPNAPKEVQVYEASRTLDSMMLPAYVRHQVESLLDEWRYRDALTKCGLQPRSIVMLHGPSGNGKTLLANAIATELSLPLVVVDYSTIVDSHLGATGKGISHALKFANSTPCVILFDEADSLVSKRDSTTEAAMREGNRAVNQVLIELDMLQHRSIIVFATNMEHDIDPALTRRVAMLLELPAPQNGEREQFIRSFAAKWDFLDYDDICASISESMSFAECEDLVRDAARASVISRAKSDQGTQSTKVR